MEREESPKEDDISNKFLGPVNIGQHAHLGVGDINNQSIFINEEYHLHHCQGRKNWSFSCFVMCLKTYYINITYIKGKRFAPQEKLKFDATKFNAI